jgi:hypothetical protein
VGTDNNDAGTTNHQRLYLNATHVAQMSDTLLIDANSAALGIGRHLSGIADPLTDDQHPASSAHERHRNESPHGTDALLFYRAHGHSAHQVLLGEEGEDDDRNEPYRRKRRKFVP